MNQAPESVQGLNFMHELILTSTAAHTIDFLHLTQEKSKLTLLTAKSLWLLHLSLVSALTLHSLQMLLPECRS